MLAALSAIVLAVIFLRNAGQTPHPERPAATGEGQARPMPLGVYWAGGYPFQETRWQHIDAALDDLAAHHVNAVWLTHLSAADTAEFARRGGRRGIAVVAALGELAGEVEAIRNGDHRTRIPRELKAWGDAPRPLSWGLGDEPRTAYMKDMAAYVRAWRLFATGEPVTTVVMHNDLDAAAVVGFDALACDVYPFFSKNNPNGYGMPPHAAWLQITRRLVTRSPRPWMMGQAFQEPKGPFKLDQQGNIVYLPGGAPQWRMPTAAEVRWQALAAVAVGAKGMFYFHYRTPVSPNPKAARSDLPAAVKEETSSHAPATLVYPDGRPTPQYEAVGEAFAWLGRVAPVLAPLQPASSPEAWETPPGGAGGTVVTTFTHPADARRYLMVVASYDASKSRPVRVTLGPHITSLKSVVSGKDARPVAAGPFRQVAVSLEPGTAELLESKVDADNLPRAYVDDLSTEKFKSDAVKVRNVKRYPGGTAMLSAADSGSKPDEAFLVYDVEKLLGPLPAGGVRVLTYEGEAAPPDSRGAFWSTSADGQEFVKLSDNEFGKPVAFDARFLKVGLSWRQAGGPNYGHLTRFSIVQWRRPAGK
jgi:hypothetical protein